MGDGIDEVNPFLSGHTGVYRRDLGGVEWCGAVGDVSGGGTDGLDDPGSPSFIYANPPGT